MGWGPDGGGSSETKSRLSDTFVIFRIMSIMLNLLLCNINDLPDLSPVYLYGLYPVFTNSPEWIDLIEHLFYSRASVCDRGVNVCCVQFCDVTSFCDYALALVSRWYYLGITSNGKEKPWNTRQRDLKLITTLAG